MIRVREIDHFGIEVTDLERARRFYCELLGMRFVRNLGDDGLLLRCGEHSIALHRNPDLPPPDASRIKNPLGKAHHAFKVSPHDFISARDAFAKRGIPTHTPIDWGDHECLYFLDPDGNLLELIMGSGMTY